MHCLLNRATQTRRPSCTRAPVTAALCRATLHEAKLHDIALNIINKKATRAWTIDIGYIFFDERLYVPVALPLLLALIDSLISGGHIHNLSTT